MIFNLYLFLSDEGQARSITIYTILHIVKMLILSVLSNICYFPGFSFSLHCPDTVAHNLLYFLANDICFPIQESEVLTYVPNSTDSVVTNCGLHPWTEYDVNLRVKPVSDGYWSDAITLMAHTAQDSELEC